MTPPVPAAAAVSSSARGREAIVAAATGLFASRGYRATTLDDVALALGIKKASLYHYIGSKEELLSEIYDRILTRIDAVVRPIAESDLPGDERLRRMVHAHVEVVSAERDMLAVVFREEPELSPTAKAAIRAHKRDYERLFEAALDEGVQSGALRPLTTRLVVLGLLGMCNWMYQWYRPDGAWSADDIAAEFVLLLESGWLGGGAAGDGRRGAWPRPDTVEEALAPLAQALDDVRVTVAAATEALGEAGTRLHDGLARPPEAAFLKRSRPDTPERGR